MDNKDDDAADKPGDDSGYMSEDDNAGAAAQVTNQSIVPVSGPLGKSFGDPDAGWSIFNLKMKKDSSRAPIGKFHKPVKPVLQRNH